jgi:hypothetical protein
VAGLECCTQCANFPCREVSGKLDQAELKRIATRIVQQLDAGMSVADGRELAGDMVEYSVAKLQAPAAEPVGSNSSSSSHRD